MAKGKRIEGAKTRSLTIHFDRPEDVELFNRVATAADGDFRRPVEQFVLKQLHELFPEPALTWAEITARSNTANLHPLYSGVETADQKA